MSKEVNTIPITDQIESFKKLKGGLSSPEAQAILKTLESQRDLENYLLKTFKKTFLAKEITTVKVVAILERAALAMPYASKFQQQECSRCHLNPENLKNKEEK